MSGRATWRGMDFYRQALLGWPQAIAEAAGPIIETRARAAFQAIHDGYPVVTGKLQRGLTIRNTSPSVMHPRWTVENAVEYAKIFEAGGMTTAGPKPQGRVFVPISIRERRRLRAELVDLFDRMVPHG